MQPIKGILFEPVGCLAEFPSDPFLELALRLFGRKKKMSHSGSRSYWHLLNLIESSSKNPQGLDQQLIETFEARAVCAASLYEDVTPALSELKAMSVKLLIASSLSRAAITLFLDRYSLNGFFSAASNRDNAGGIKAAPLNAAIAGASLKPDQVLFLTDTLEGLRVARAAQVHPILMMNDPDEARRLAMHNPSGGIVSLHELPDFIRVVAAENSDHPGTIKFSSSGSMGL